MSLKQIASDLGIADYEWRGFDHAFTNYVNLVDCDGYTHSEACAALPVNGERWKAALADLYRVILDQPELYW
jgi:hypothetical protein